MKCFRCEVELRGHADWDFLDGFPLCRRCYDLVDTVLHSKNDWYMAGPEPYHIDDAKATGFNDYLYGSPVV